MDDGASPKLNAERNNWFGDFLKRLIRRNSGGVTEEEIISMVNEGHEKGVLETSKAEMLHNIFEFTDKEAQDIMTHRKKIRALDSTLTLRQTLDQVLEEPYSRFPVFLNDIDNIIGILHIKEVMAFSRNEEVMDTQIKDIEGLFSEGEFVPQTCRISDLFQKMQQKKAHMVIVVDEYGQTCGLAAMEDILEEIVGNIFDEHDKENQMIEKISDRCYLAQGMAALDDVGKALDIQFDQEEYDTLNGFLISQIHKIPSDGETFSIHYSGCTFDVAKAANKMVQIVRISKDSACHSTD